MHEVLPKLKLLDPACGSGAFLVAAMKTLINATGMDENTVAAKTGGNIAQKARLELEQKTGQSVVTGQNYLPPAQTRKLKRPGR